MATERDVMAGAPQRTSEAGRAGGRTDGVCPSLPPLRPGRGGCYRGSCVRPRLSWVSLPEDGAQASAHDSDGLAAASSAQLGTATGAGNCTSAIHK